LFVGIDWAAEKHDVCVQEDTGKTVASFRAEHSAAGFEDLVRRLGRFGPPATVPVGIERPDGRLVDHLLEAGHPVVPVSPKAIKLWREAEFSTQAKSGAGDAQVICDYLRLRFHQLQVLEPFSRETRALRAAVRTRDDLVAQRVRTSNQLRATLEAFWPGAADMFSSLLSKISLAFWETYPVPASAVRLGERRMEAFLHRHHYTGRQSASALVSRLRAAPPGLLLGPEVEARKAAVLAFVVVLRSFNHGIVDLDRSVSAHLGEHPDRRDLHLAATLSYNHGRPDARRVGRQPNSLRRS
jgi:hypothetical protein